MERTQVGLLMGTQEKGQVALSKKQLIEMAVKSLVLGISECFPRSLLGQGKAVCNRIRFLSPVTLGTPNSCQKASHMPGQCMRSLGS